MRRALPLMLFALAAFFAASLGSVTAVAFRVDAFSRNRPAPKKAAAIVVLGARVQPNGEAAPALRRRAEKAAELYREGLAPLMVFSGGVAGARPSEARVARDIAVTLGVPAEACVLEEGSHSTAQNAQLTAPLLKERQIEEVLLVTDGYHLFRANQQFTQAGIRSMPVASERSLSSFDQAYWTVREAFALLRKPLSLFG